MPFNGSGTFVRVYSWQTDKANGVKIRADRMDGEDDGFATGLSDCVTRDGQSPATANLPMGGFKHTNAAVASARTDYLRASQIQDNDLIYWASTGTDTYTITPAPAVTAYTTGQGWYVNFGNANTVTTPTLNVSGVGAKTITNADGSVPQAGEVKGILRVMYDGTNFQIVGRKAATVLGFNNGGVKAQTDFTAVVDTQYVVYPGTAGNAVTLPNAAANQGRFLLLVKVGPYSMNLCGTINGAAGTLPIDDRQSLLLSCTSVDGWA